MTDYTPTTPVIRGAYVQLNSGTSWDSKQPRLAEFDRWLERVKAEAWDEGFADGVNHDLGDWENAPSIINNPYRQEKDA